MTHSYTDLLTYLRCPKKYEFQVVRNLQRKATGVNLYLGILIHNLLMGHYLGTYDETMAEMVATLEDAPLIDDEILEYRDLVDQAEELVLRYLSKHDDEWEILHVEETFVVTLEDGNQISFTPDLIIRDERGVWVVDHKSTSMMPRGDLPVGNFQAFLYSAAIREIYPDFRGFIFNFMRKKLPTQPRLTKTAPLRIADIGRIDTTYEILHEYVMRVAPQLVDDPATRRRLVELQQEDKFFWRQYVFVTDELSDNVMDDTVAVIEHVELALSTGRFPRSFLPYAGAQECDNCSFKELCVAELRGYDTSSVLFLYEERDMSYRQYDHEEEVLLDAPN